MYSKCVPRVVINNVLASTSGRERHRTKCTVVFVAVSIGHLDSESIAFVTSTNYVPGNVEVTPRRLSAAVHEHVGSMCD